MRVKVGDIWYDAHDLPIKIELTEGEREQVTQIREPSENGRYGYAVLPIGTLGWTEVQAYEWMKDERLAYLENANRRGFKESIGEIEIYVTGDRPEIGKTLVAALITQSLLQAGFSDVAYSCTGGDLPRYLAVKNQANRALLGDLLKTEPRVVVHDNNQQPTGIPRPGYPVLIGDDIDSLDPDEPVEMTIEFAGMNPSKSE